MRLLITPHLNATRLIINKDYQMNLKLKNIAIVSGLVASILQLSGCSTLIGSATTYGNYAKDRDMTNNALNSQQKINSFVNNINGIYVDKTPIKVNGQNNRLLEVYSEDIVFSSNSLMGITEISDRLTKLTKIPVMYSDTSKNAKKAAPGMPVSTEFGGFTDSAGSNVSGAPKKSGELDDILDSIPTLPGISSNRIYSNSSFSTLGFPGDIPMIDVVFSGKITDFLDMVSGRTGLFWKYDNVENRIVFFKYDTKTFTFYIMPGNMEINANLTNSSETSSVAGGAGGGGGGGGAGASGSTSRTQSGQDVSMNVSVKLWDQTLGAIKEMLSSGGRIQGNEAMGTVTVTDTPVVLSEIERYSNQMNKSMSRQVTFNVAIYDIELGDENQLGIDWNFVWNKAAMMGSGFTATSLAASAVGSGFKFMDSSPKSEASGSTAMVKALETQGRVSLKRKLEAATINNTPIPVKVADETTYLASTSGGTTGDSGVGVITTGITPGKVVTGLTMTLLPRIFDANQLMLQMTLDLSTLKEISTISSGDQSIQAPRVGTKSFMQRVALRNNESLILSGFDENKNSISGDQSMGIPAGLFRSESRIMTVIIITPRITEGVSGE